MARFRKAVPRRRMRAQRAITALLMGILVFGQLPTTAFAEVAAASAADSIQAGAVSGQEGQPAAGDAPAPEQGGQSAPDAGLDSAPGPAPQVGDEPGPDETPTVTAPSQQDVSGGEAPVAGEADPDPEGGPVQSAGTPWVDGPAAAPSLAPAPAADPVALTVNVSVTGATKPDQDGVFMQETWIEPVAVALDKPADGESPASAWDVIKPQLDDAGYTCTSHQDHGTVLTAIESPDKYTVANTDEGVFPAWTWQLFVNGERFDGPVDGYRIKDGDAIELRYDTDDTVQGAADQVISVSLRVVGIAAEGDMVAQEWLPLERGEYAPGTSVYDVIHPRLTAAKLNPFYRMNDDGRFIDGVTAPYGGTVDNNDTASWKCLINGQPIASGLENTQLEDGDAIELVYTSDKEDVPGEETVSVSASVIGPNADGKNVNWGSVDGMELESGATAATASEQLFKAAGIQAKYASNEWGWFLSTITSPFTGEEMGFDIATQRQWHLFVNGQMTSLSTSAASIELKDGDTIAWAHTANDESLPQVEVFEVTASIIGPDAQGSYVGWAPETAIEVELGDTAATASERLFEKAGIKANYASSEWGWFLSNITSPFTGEEVGFDIATQRQWHLFVNGEDLGLSASISSVQLKKGDRLVWAHVANGDPIPDITPIQVGISVLGPNASGATASWAINNELELLNGTSAAEATEKLLKDSNLDFKAEQGQDGWQLESIISPFTDESLGRNDKTGEFWQLYVNGKATDQPADSVKLKDGDVISWAYSVKGQELPEVADIPVNPQAEHPDLGSDWAGFGNAGAGSAVDNGLTATEDGKLAWDLPLLSDEDLDNYKNVTIGDPLIIGGKLYVVASRPYNAWTAQTKANARLMVVDPATGKVEREVDLARPLDYFCRPVYSDGIIVIPLAKDYIQAVSAKTLETMWAVPGIDVKGMQSINSLWVDDGFVYVSTAKVEGEVAAAGVIRRIDLRTGKVMGRQETAETGSYWSGGVTEGDYFLIGDDAGKVTVYKRDLSAVVSSLDLGAPVRTTLVKSGDAIYAVTTNGKLHKLRLSKKGNLSSTGVATFATGSESTPTIVDGKAYVGGEVVGWKGVLAVIDVASMKVERTVLHADGKEIGKEVQSSPLVSTVDGETFVYFTCNDKPGGAYVYRVGDSEASMLYEPEERYHEYGTASIVAGPDGKLYFSNDAGCIFAVAPAGKGGQGDEGDKGEGEPQDPQDPQGPSGGSGDENGGGNDEGSGGSDDKGDDNGAGGNRNPGGFVPQGGRLPAGTVPVTGGKVSPKTGTVTTGGKVAAKQGTVTKAGGTKGASNQKPAKTGKVSKAADGTKATAADAPLSLLDRIIAFVTNPTAMFELVQRSLPVIGITAGSGGLLAIGVWVGRQRLL